MILKSFTYVSVDFESKIKWEIELFFLGYARKLDDCK